MSIIKSDIAKELMKVAPISYASAVEIVDTFLETLKQAMMNGQRIEIRGFGVFESRDKKTGYGRNIRGEEMVEIRPGRSVRFKPGKELRDMPLIVKKP